MFHVLWWELLTVTTLLISHICCVPSARLKIPKAHNNSKPWADFGVFAVKYTYFMLQNILIEAKNILMMSYTYEAKICRTTHVPDLALHKLT